MKKKNLVLTIILIIGMLTSVVTVFERAKVESKDKSVEVILDYEEIEKMVKQSDYDLSWWLKKFNELGVSSVALKEETLESLIEEKLPLKVELAGNFIKELDWKKKSPEKLVSYIEKEGIDEYDVIALTNDESVFKFIKKGLEGRYDQRKFQFFTDEDRYHYAIVLDSALQDTLFSSKTIRYDNQGKGTEFPQKPETSKLIQLGLGFNEEKIDLIQASGLKIIPRPHSYKNWTDEKYIKAIIKDYEDYHMVPEVLISIGKEVLGYPDNISLFEEYMKKNNFKVGLIETPVQRENLEVDGLEEFVENLNYRAVRIFSTWEYIQERFKYYNYEGAEEIENTFYRAVTERNIRVIYFRPFKYDKVSYVTDPVEYEKMFARFESRIADHGMSIGEASVLAYRNVGFFRQLLMGWGIAAAVVYLASYIIEMKDKEKYGLLAIGLVGVFGTAFKLPSHADKIFALVSAITFPSLAMVYFCSRCKKYLKNKNEKGSFFVYILIGIKELLITSGISFIGALFVAALLSDSKYLLEMDIFRGVKFSQLLPIVAYFIIYMGYFGYKNKGKLKEKNTFEINDYKSFLFDNIQIVYVIVGVILLIVGYIYIARTGHESNVQAPSIELIGRNILEEILIARPRTKEFIGAFPAVIIGIYAALKGYNKLIFIAGLGVIIGQTSIVNTFSHLRTPIYLSFIRTLIGLGFGAILAIVYAALIEIAMKIFRSFGRRKL